MVSPENELEQEFFCIKDIDRRAVAHENALNKHNKKQDSFRAIFAILTELILGAGKLMIQIAAMSSTRTTQQWKLLSRHNSHWSLQTVEHGLFRLYLHIGQDIGHNIPKEKHR